MIITETLKQHTYNQKHQRFKRKMAKLHKEKEMIKNSYFQKKCDRLERSMRMKGSGRSLKIKGEVMPMPLASNDRWTKAIARHCNKTESFKHFALIKEEK